MLLFLLWLFGCVFIFLSNFPFFFFFLLEYQGFGRVVFFFFFFFRLSLRYQYTDASIGSVLTNSVVDIRVQLVLSCSFDLSK